MTNYSFIYDYEEGESDELIHIKIDDGVFSGIIFKYGKVDFGYETPEGFKNVNFQYDIIEDSNKKITKKNTKKFIDIIGNILIELIEIQMNQSKGNGKGEH